MLLVERLANQERSPATLPLPWTEPEMVPILGELVELQASRGNPTKFP